MIVKMYKKLDKFGIFVETYLPFDPYLCDFDI